jgi:Thiol-disulfide isomerase and thioredoxins
MLPPYSFDAPERANLDASRGWLLLEFGSNGCGICHAATPSIAAALAERPDLLHLRIQDGKGLRLGRSYAVKLWPTLILLHDGREVRRLVRPRNTAEISTFLAACGSA